MKVGKLVAISVGGSIILLQIASNEGYISIDWSKVTKNVNKVTDKVEEAVTGEGPSFADKVCIFKTLTRNHSSVVNQKS